MDVTLLFKLWTDLFLYASAAALFLPMRGAVPPLLLCGILSAVPLLVGQRAKNGWILAAAGLVPFLCLLFARGALFLLALAPRLFAREKRRLVAGLLRLVFGRPLLRGGRALAPGRPS